MIYYCKSEGFFVEGVSKNIPKTAIPISEETYRAALEQQSLGNSFSICKDGKLSVKKLKPFKNPRADFQYKGYHIELDLGTIAYIVSPLEKLTLHVGEGQYLRVSGKEREELKALVEAIEEKMFDT